MTDENTSKPEEEAPAAAPPPSAEETVIEPETLPAGEPASIGNRILAYLIDGIVIIPLYIIPILGPLAAIAYMLTRDALPFLDGQSIGKKVMKLRVVSSETGKPMTNDYGAVVVRTIVLSIPLFVFVELYMMNKNSDNSRLGDEWSKTKVITAG